MIHPAHHKGAAAERSAKYLRGGYGGLVGIELKGGADAGRAFIDRLQMIYHVANIGDARTLAIHPASTTHSQLAAEEQLATGVSPGYVRLSIGIEHIDDILADLAQALAGAGGEAGGVARLLTHSGGENLRLCAKHCFFLLDILFGMSKGISPVRYRACI